MAWKKGHYDLVELMLKTNSRLIKPKICKKWWYCYVFGNFCYSAFSWKLEWQDNTSWIQRSMWRWKNGCSINICSCGSPGNFWFHQKNQTWFRVVSRTQRLFLWTCQCVLLGKKRPENRHHYCCFPWQIKMATALSLKFFVLLLSILATFVFFDWQTTITKRKIVKIPTFIFATSKSNDFTSKGQLWSEFSLIYDTAD